MPDQREQAGSDQVIDVLDAAELPHPADRDCRARQQRDRAQPAHCRRDCDPRRRERPDGEPAQPHDAHRCEHNAEDARVRRVDLVIPLEKFVQVTDREAYDVEHEGDEIEDAHGSSPARMLRGLPLAVPRVAVAHAVVATVTAREPPEDGVGTQRDGSDGHCSHRAVLPCPDERQWTRHEQRNDSGPGDR